MVCVQSRWCLDLGSDMHIGNIFGTVYDKLVSLENVPYLDPNHLLGVTSGGYFFLVSMEMHYSKNLF